MSASQQYQSIPRKLSKLRTSINVFHMNSVKVKEFWSMFDAASSKCEWYISWLYSDWEMSILWHSETFGSMAWLWWRNQTLFKTERATVEDYRNSLIAWHWRYLLRLSRNLSRTSEVYCQKMGEMHIHLNKTRPILLHEDTRLEMAGLTA